MSVNVVSTLDVLRQLIGEVSNLRTELREKHQAELAEKEAESQALKASHAELLRTGSAVFGPILDSTYYDAPFTEEHKKLLEAWDDALVTARKVIGEQGR